MTSRLITDAADWNYAINDGFTRFEFVLDPGGRVDLSAGEFYNREFEPQLRGSFSADSIDKLADALKAIAARSRGESN